MKPNLQFIRERAELLRQLREFFDARGFLEVQPPCLASDCVVDAYLDPVSVDASQLQVGSLDLPPKMLLQTSPESSMKRMLAAGAPSIYSIGPVFRGGEHGPLHNAEFTMLEWYEVGGDLNSGIQLLGTLAVQMLGTATFNVQSYRDIFLEILDVDPFASSLERLREVGRPQDQSLLDSLGRDRDAILDVLLSTRVQPQLDSDQPIIIKDYPLSQAALARQSSDDARCAGRFELFASGIELANGYDELTDAEVFLARAGEHNRKRALAGRPELLEKSKLYDAMREPGIPPCAGVALGVDRLLMVRVGATTIDQVIPLPLHRA